MLGPCTLNFFLSHWRKIPNKAEDGWIRRTVLFVLKAVKVLWVIGLVDICIISPNTNFVICILLSLCKLYAKKESKHAKY